MMAKWIAIPVVMVLIMGAYGHPIEPSHPSEKKMDGEEIIFQDDFDDNSKDYSKWSEIYTDGEWEERNGRAEFKLNEPGYGTAYEGIESTEFSVLLNPITPLNISWDIITDVGSTGWAGRIYLEVTDGTNWIWAMYHRYRGAIMFMDSNDEEAKYINEYKPEGEWHNLIQIYSDRYVIQMGGDSTGEIKDGIFSPGAKLRIRLYIADSGSQPGLYMKCAFDNILVTFEKPEVPISLIFGKISNLTAYENEMVTFNADFVVAIPIFPPSFNMYHSGEKMFILEPKRTGVITLHYIFGLFKVGTVNK